MSFITRLDADLRGALKARDEIKLSTIRLIKASLKNKFIEKGRDLTEDELRSVLASLAKQRRESIEQFSAAGRADLAAKEQQELDITLSYLPRQLNSQELDTIILGAIDETSAASSQDMGKVMKLVIQKTRGLADGKEVSERVKALLNTSKPT